MYVKEGFQPFYRGALPPSIGKMISYCVFFTTNGYLKDLLMDYRGLGEGDILSLSDTLSDFHPFPLLNEYTSPIHVFLQCVK